MQEIKNIRKHSGKYGSIFSSYIHQGNDLFSVQSRGKQRAFMSLSALLTAQNIPLIDWSKTGLANSRGSWVVGRMSWVECHDIVGRMSWVKSRGSWVKSRGSWVKSRGSWVKSRG